MKRFKFMKLKGKSFKIQVMQNYYYPTHLFMAPEYCTLFELRSSKSKQGRIHILLVQYHATKPVLGKTYIKESHFDYGLVKLDYQEPEYQILVNPFPQK